MLCEAVATCADSVFCPADSENSYTLSCGVPVQQGKAQQKRNATLPSCAGRCSPARPGLGVQEVGNGGPPDHLGGARHTALKLHKARIKVACVSSCAHSLFCSLSSRAGVCLVALRCGIVLVGQCRSSEGLRYIQ